MSLTFTILPKGETPQDQAKDPSALLGKLMSYIIRVYFLKNLNLYPPFIIAMD